MRLSQIYKQNKMSTKKKIHQVQSVVILALMFSLAMLVSFTAAGHIGLIICLIFIVGNIAVRLQINPRTTMKLMRARMLNHYEYPALFEMRKQLCQRAGLSHQPELYLVPGHNMNAFATGSVENSVIGFSESMLRKLSLRETCAVMSHEIAHIHNNDLTMMNISNGLWSFTQNLAQIMQIWVLLMFPFWILNLVNMSVLGIIILLISPSLSALLHLALSRTRELEADRTASYLSGDPEGLAMALTKLHSQHVNWWTHLLDQFGIRLKQEIPEYLRTHPSPEDRIRILREYPSQPELISRILTRSSNTRSYNQFAYPQTLYRFASILRIFGLRI